MRFHFCVGCSQMKIEFPKLNAAGSIPVSRSKIRQLRDTRCWVAVSFLESQDGASTYQNVVSE
jgi:hypothetical protein